MRSAAPQLAVNAFPLQPCADADDQLSLAVEIWVEADAVCAHDLGALAAIRCLCQGLNEVASEPAATPDPAKEKLCSSSSATAVIKK